MGMLLAKLANYWQFRLVSIAACLALVVYAVMMPVHSSELLNASDFASTNTPGAPNSTMPGQGIVLYASPGLSEEDGKGSERTFKEPSSGARTDLGATVASVWLGQNPAVVNRLREVSLLYGDGAVSRDASDVIVPLHRLALAGDVTAEFLYGAAYQSGIGMPQDVFESAHWFTKAAQDRKKKMAAGEEAVPENYDEALGSFRRAAEAGQTDAELYMGLFDELTSADSPHFVEAARWYRKAASQGSVSAACNLGLLYQEGKGVPQDNLEAVQWLRLAADRGSASAQYALGRAYLNGAGVGKNDSLGASWLEKAAAKNHSQAQLILSWMYASGRGVPGSSAKAYMWINLAASSDSRLREPREEIGTLVSEADLLEGQRLTHDWLLQRHGAIEKQIGLQTHN